MDPADGTIYFSLLGSPNADVLVALRGRQSPSSKSLPSSCLGDSHSCYPHPASLSGRGHFSRHGHDQEQQEKGSKGQGGSS